MHYRIQLFSISLLFLSLPIHAQVGTDYSAARVEKLLEEAKTRPDNRSAFEVEIPIHSAFNTLLSELPNYSNDVESLRFDNTNSIVPNSIGIGFLRISRMGNDERLVQNIIYFDPPHSFAYLTNMSASTVNIPIDYSIGFYRFTELQGGNTLIEVSAAYKPSSRLTAFIIRIGFNRAFKSDFEKAEEYLNSLDPL